MPPACGGPLGSRITTRHPTPVFTAQTLWEAFPFIRWKQWHGQSRLTWVSEPGHDSRRPIDHNIKTGAQACWKPAAVLGIAQRRCCPFDKHKSLFEFVVTGMLFRRRDLSSVSHAWNRDESKHNGCSWGRAWKTRLLLWAAVAAGCTDAPRNRANIGATEFSPCIHHFSALSTNGHLDNSYEEVVFPRYLFRQSIMTYSSNIFSQCLTFFWSQ